MDPSKMKVQVVIFHRGPDKKNSQPDHQSEELRGVRFLSLLTIPPRGAFWQNVTGGVEPEEYLVQAAHREVHEETGLKGLNPAVDLQYQFTYPTRNGAVREYVFAIEAEDLHVKIDSVEHQDFKWLEFSEARERIRFDSNKEALDRAKNWIETGSPGPLKKESLV